MYIQATMWNKSEAGDIFTVYIRGSFFLSILRGSRVHLQKGDATQILLDPLFLLSRRSAGHQPRTSDVIPQLFLLCVLLFSLWRGIFLSVQARNIRTPSWQDLSYVFPFKPTAHPSPFPGQMGWLLLPACLRRFLQASGLASEKPWGALGSRISLSFWPNSPVVVQLCKAICVDHPRAGVGVGWGVGGHSQLPWNHHQGPGYATKFKVAWLAVGSCIHR